MGGADLAEDEDDLLVLLFELRDRLRRDVHDEEDRHRRGDDAEEADEAPLALEWFLEMHRQTLALPPGERWWERPAPFKMPVLAIVGSDDAQVAPETREAFKRMARENPEKFLYIEVPGGGHDVFAGASFRGEAAVDSEADKIRAARAWQYVYWFLKAKVLGDAGVVEPAFGWRYVP